MHEIKLAYGQSLILICKTIAFTGNFDFTKSVAQMGSEHELREELISENYNFAYAQLKFYHSSILGVAHVVKIPRYPTLFKDEIILQIQVQLIQTCHTIYRQLESHLSYL